MLGAIRRTSKMHSSTINWGLIHLDKSEKHRIKVASWLRMVAEPMQLEYCIRRHVIRKFIEDTDCEYDNALRVLENSQC